MNEVILNKKISVERCVAQIGKYYSAKRELPLRDDFLLQDAIAMNLQRACELCIDMANHLIKKKKLGLPQESKESFELLQKAGIIGQDMTKRLQAMVGFRNVLVHEYKRLDINLMAEIVEKHLSELLDFANAALKASE